MEVNAKLTAVGKSMNKLFEAAMDKHITESVNHAKTSKRWTDRTGAATSSIQSETDAGQAQITSTIYGDIMTNVYLETAWFFRDEYKILEEARSHNLYLLFAELRAIAAGGGYGFRLGS